jgi:hypothetical protein
MKDYYFSSSLIVALGVVANILLIKSSIFGAILAVVYLALASGGWSRLFTTKTKVEALTYGFFISIALLSIIGGLVYKIYQLDDLTTLLVLILVIIAPAFISEFYQESDTSPKMPISTLVFLTLGTICSGILTYILTDSATTESIRSPWEVIPTIYFSLLFLFWLIWIIGLLRLPQERPWYILPSFFCLALYNIYIIALIIYPIGFGFDSFIHQATEKLIAVNGVANPKPWYYLGQYSFVVIFHKLSLLPIAWIDKLFLPLTAITALSFIGVQSLEKFLNKGRATTLTIAALLLIPATFLIATTPQGLANLLFAILVLVAMVTSSSYLLFLLAFTATIIHPLAGIPALLLATLVSLSKYSVKFSTPISIIITLLAIPIMPLLFWWQNSQQILTTNFFPLASSSADSSIIYLTNRFDFIFDTIYLWHWNGLLIIILLAILGIIIAYKKSLHQLLPFIFLAIYLLANYALLSKTIDFDFLISYERASFADRFIDLSVIAVIPFVSIALHFIFVKLLKYSENWRLQFIALSFALLATITVYTIYPRIDAYETSRGYSTSQTDIEAVKFIHQDSNGENYVVLANQSVSSSALHELGFSKYYERQDNKTGEQIFFYPIPTGGSLYQIYLEMVYSAPTREVAEKAMSLTGVDTVYFVLNDYWFNSEKLNEIALTEANENFAIEDKIYIYKFVKK